MFVSPLAHFRRQIFLKQREKIFRQKHFSFTSRKRRNSTKPARCAEAVK